MTGFSAAGFAVYCFAAHASVNSPLQCWVLDGEWCRLQNVESLALTLRSPLHAAHATAQQGPTGKRRRSDAHVCCPTVYNSHYVIRLASAAAPARAVGMNQPTAMPIDQSARAFAGGREGPRWRDRRERYFATGSTMACRVARKMA